jgi:hypothetical protein
MESPANLISAAESATTGEAVQAGLSGAVFPQPKNPIRALTTTTKYNFFITGAKLLQYSMRF